MATTCVLVGLTAWWLRSAQTAQPGVEAHYALSDATGTSAVDGTGNGNAMSIAGASWTTGGRFGSALSFDGLADQAQIAASPTTDLTTAFTIAAWAYPLQYQAGAIVSRGNGGSYVLELLASGQPRVQALVNGTVRTALSPAALPAAAWSHVAAVFDGVALRLYVNGSEMATTAAAGAIVTSPDPLFVGSKGTAGFFSGRLDELRVYGRSSTPTELALLAATPIDTSTAFQVSLASPGAGSLGVLATPVAATFSRAVNASSVNGSTFTLRDSTNTLIPATVGYDPARRTATLTPTASLAAGAVYTASVASGSAGVLGTLGEVLPADVSWGFTTAMPSTMPTAEFGLSESAGTVSADTSGHGNWAWLLNGPTWATGKHTSGLSFDGSDDLVHVYASDTTQLTGPFTYEAWINRATTSPGSILRRRLPDWQTEVVSVTVNATGRVVVGAALSGGYRSVTSPTALATNVWIHVATTYDGATLRLYVDGTQVGDVAGTGTLPSTSHPLVFGESFTGTLDEVRVYRRALSASEVVTDMTTPVDDTGPTVVAVNPLSNQTNVVVTTAVSATFNEPLTSSSVTASTFELRTSAGVLIPATVGYTSATRTATLTPSSALEDGVTYTATLRGGTTGARITDVLGNPLSATVSWSFTTHHDGVLMAPTFSPGAGTYTTSATVSMVAQIGSTIRYTINGAEPTTTSTVYTSPVTLTATTVVKAKAFRTGFTASDTRIASYTVKVAAPAISPAPGAWVPGTTITIASATPGARIHYTVDGREPTNQDSLVSASSPLYVGNYTLKVRAFGTGLEPSDVAARSYALSATMSPGTVAAGSNFSVAVGADGAVAAWGQNGLTRLLGVVYCSTFGLLASDRPVAAEPTGIVSLSTTFSATAAVRTDGSVVSWGDNQNQQLGHAPPLTSCTSLDTADRPTARPVPGLSGVARVDGGQNHFLALKTNGTVMGWGRNVEGQLGDTTQTDRLTPVPVSSLTGITQVSAGGTHSLAVKSDGTVWAWGANNSGQLGVTGGTRTSPVQVSGVSNPVAIAAGWNTSFAVLANGTVWTWGAIPSGLIAGAPLTSTTPRQITALSGIASVAPGQTATYALGLDGRIWAWGGNTYGQLGDQSTVTRNTPGLVVQLPAVRTVSAGTHHAVAVAADGSVWSWGRNASGQVGDLFAGTDRLAPALALHAGALEAMVSGTPGTYDPASDVVRYYHTDAVGSVRVVTDATGQVVQRYDYQPFGKEWPGPAGGERRRFASTEKDAETGLDYFGARYYGGQIGRFTTVDPGHVAGDIFNPQTWNAYAYALNNPLRFVDPLGLEPCQITLIGADAAAAGVESGGKVQGECVRGRKESASQRLSRNVFGLLDAFLLTAPLQAPGLGQDDQPLVDRSPDLGVSIAAAVVMPRALSAKGTTLAKTMQSEAGVAELLAGGGRVIAGAGSKVAIKDMARLVSRYGGKASDWVKISSTTPGLETHAYRNIVTGAVVELKSKIPDFR